MKRDHYHLVAGEVLFADPSQDNALGSIKLNTMIVTPDGNVTVRHIGKAQQTLQMLMFQKLEDPNLKVMDVFIMGVSPLGRMTEKEFTKDPPGQTLQEIAPQNPAELN